MRTIKFRGRDFAGMWHKGDLIHNDNDLLIRQGCLSTFIENETAGQFTGLFDFSKKKIWEGDIVNVSCLNYTGLAVIKFIDGAFCMVGENWIETLNGFDTDSLDIIGNIHDNPELLKGGIYEGN